LLKLASVSLALFVLTSTCTMAAQGIRLNRSAEEVSSFAVSPDGGWVVYLDPTGYHSAPLLPLGPAQRLTPPDLTTLYGTNIVWGPEVGFTPNSSQVFLSVSTSSGTFLYRAPIDGSQPATLFMSRASSAAGPNFKEFVFTPDGATVFFVYRTGDPSVGSNVERLYSAPVDGSQAPLLLESAEFVAHFLSGDGTRLVVVEGPVSFSGGFNLYSLPTDGSAPADTLLASGYETSGGLQLTADRTQVVYRANLFLGGGGSLFSARIDASQPPTQATLTPTGLYDFLLNPVTPHIAYTAPNGNLRELRYVPMDGSSAEIVLVSLPPAGLLSEITHFIFTPDGTHLVYRADAIVDNKFELFSVPVDGSLPPVQINGPILPAGGDVTASTNSGSKPHFAVTPDGQRVVYAADARLNDVFELWSAPLTGGGPAQILNNPLPPGLQVFPDFQILSNSTDILFRGNPAAGYAPLWEARTDRTGPFKQRSGPFPLPSVVQPGYVVTRGERHVVYLSDHLTPGHLDLFAAPLQKLRAR